VQSTFMSIVKAIGIRVLVGLGTSLIGLVLSWLTHDWKISYTYFTLFGALLLVIAAFPYSIGSKRAERKVRLVLNRKIDMGVSQGTKEENANWSITLGIIGGINVLLPVLVYYFLIYIHQPRA
jgi:hypothetical protein